GCAEKIFLERKDCRKLRANIVRGITRDATEQRQQAHARIRACTVVTFLVCKRYPLVPFVLDIAGEEIAAPAAQTKPSRITRFRLIEAVVKERGPTRVASLRIRIEYSRQRKAELNKAALRAHGSLWRHDSKTVIQSKGNCRCAIDRSRGGDAGQSRSVVEVGEQLPGEEETQIGAAVILPNHGDEMRRQLKLGRVPVTVAVNFHAIRKRRPECDRHACSGNNRGALLMFEAEDQLRRRNARCFIELPLKYRASLNARLLRVNSL